MSTKPEQSSADSAPINLKHRITGAGVLIFFGVLVLPWLLGPPSEATKNPVAVEQQSEPLHSTFEDEILSELEGIQGERYVQPEETVYVSKITPLSDESGLSTPQPVKESNSASTKPEVQQANPETVSKSAENNAVSSANIKTTKPEQSSANENVSSESKDKATTGAASPSKQAAKPVAKAPKIDVGWVVQVELLTDKSGANRLMSELRDKGFSPSTTIVDTNRGKKTGTRIWLGPFAQRAQAGVENDKLESKMGKRGFIRVYP